MISGNENVWNLPVKSIPDTYTVITSLVSFKSHQLNRSLQENGECNSLYWKLFTPYVSENKKIKCQRDCTATTGKTEGIYKSRGLHKAFNKRHTTLCEKLLTAPKNLYAYTNTALNLNIIKNVHLTK